MAERISDDALVVRGGRNQPVDLERGTGTHPSGTTGVPVECASGLTVEQLSAFIPHGQIGVTTVAAVPSMGGDVIRTSGRSRSRATLTGLTPEEMSSLLSPTVRKPTKGGSRFGG